MCVFSPRIRPPEHELPALPEIQGQRRGVEWSGEERRGEERGGAAALARWKCSLAYASIFRWTPDKTNFADGEEGTIPWLNFAAVNDRLIIEPSTDITAEALANSSAEWIPEGALVIALAGQGKTKGRVAQLAIPST
jgi:hypothetical protein